MKREYFIWSCSFAVVVFVPLAAHAAGSGLFNPIIPTECTCTGRAPDYGCVFQVVQNGMNLFVSVATVIITLFIALAGFTYMTSGDSAEKRQLANKRIINAILGLAIVLCAYLLVDGIMKTLYDGNNQNQSQFGPWNSILAPKADGSDLCLTRQEPPSKLPDMVGSGAANNGAGGNGVPQTPVVGAPGSTKLNISAATQYAASHAKHPPYSGSNKLGQCAVYVREALAAGGLKSFSSNHPGDAFQYGSFLRSAGFSEVYSGTYSSASESTSGLQAGDVVVFQPAPATNHNSGHIALYTGSQWISDFIQNHMNPAKNLSDYNGISFTIYRP